MRGAYHQYGTVCCSPLFPRCSGPGVRSCCSWLRGEVTVLQAAPTLGQAVAGSSGVPGMPVSAMAGPSSWLIGSNGAAEAQLQGSRVLGFWGSRVLGGVGF